MKNWESVYAVLTNIFNIHTVLNTENYKVDNRIVLK